VQIKKENRFDGHHPSSVSMSKVLKSGFKSIYTYLLIQMMKTQQLR
jgi:hypothetical protein